MHAAGLQRAHLEMKGGKRAEIETEGEERCWQMDAVCSLAQYPKRLTSSRAVFFFLFLSLSLLWIQRACPKRQSHL